MPSSLPSRLESSTPGNLRKETMRRTREALRRRWHRFWLPPGGTAPKLGTALVAAGESGLVDSAVRPRVFAPRVAPLPGGAPLPSAPSVEELVYAGTGVDLPGNVPADNLPELLGLQTCKGMQGFTVKRQPLLLFYLHVVSFSDDANRRCGGALSNVPYSRPRKLSPSEGLPGLGDKSQLLLLLRLRSILKTN